MGKSEGDSDRKLVYVSIGLSLCIGLVLGGVIVFLELRSEREIASLRSKVNSLTQEVTTFQHNLRHLNKTVVALDKKVKSEDEPNNDEYDYYDDPNSNSYDDEEVEDEAYNDTPAPPSNSDVSITQSDQSKNDTRPKRESALNFKSFTKTIFPPHKAYSGLSLVETKDMTKSSEKESSNQSKFNFLASSSMQHKIQSSLDMLKLNSAERTSKILLSEVSEKNQSQPKVKKKRHLKASSSELQNTDLMHRHKRGGRREEVEVFTRPEFPDRNEGNSETVAAHYEADESKCRNIRHHHCDRDVRNRRYHPQNHLKDWQGATWMNLLGVSSGIEMTDGVLVVQNSGLYFIYAQILYADNHDFSGFRVLQNNDPILQCTSTTFHEPKNDNHVRHKRNSCFTGSLVHLQRGDRLVLNETEENRYTLFEKSKSFFGLFKVGNL